MSSTDKLEEELAKVFSNPEQARLLVKRAGYPIASVPQFQTAYLFWSKILESVRAGIMLDGISRIAEEAARLYPANAVFAGVSKSSPTSSAPAPNGTGVPPQSQSAAAGLPTQTILQILQAAMNAGLDKQRDAINETLPEAAKQAMPSPGSTTKVTVLTDLNKLNSMAKAGDSEPLRMWLTVAQTLGDAFPSAVAVFVDALTQLD